MVLTSVNTYASILGIEMKKKTVKPIETFTKEQAIQYLSKLMKVSIADLQQMGYYCLDIYSPEEYSILRELFETVKELKFTYEEGMDGVGKTYFKFIDPREFVVSLFLVDYLFGDKLLWK